jgi:hypothetical protein
MIIAPGDDSRNDGNTAHPPNVFFMWSSVVARIRSGTGAEDHRGKGCADQPNLRVLVVG